MVESPGFILLQFPLVDLHSLFIESQVALVAASADLTICQRGGDGAAGLLSVGAVPELALAQIPTELWKGILQILFQNDFHLIRIKGGEARSIRDQSIADGIDLHMAGRMPAAAQLFADLAHRQLQRRIQHIKDAGLAHTGISGKSRKLAAEPHRIWGI